MSNSISISDVQNPNLKWTKSGAVTVDEIDYIKQNYCVSRKRQSIARALIIPIRTTRENLRKDLFFPTFINQCNRIHSVAGKVFAKIGAFLVDLITMPIRLFTWLPRFLINRHHEKHPLLTYLSTQLEVHDKFRRSEQLLVTLTTGTGETKKYVDLIEMPPHHFPQEFITRSLSDE